MNNRQCFLLWAIVVVLMVSTIALQYQVISFTKNVSSDEHPKQHKMLSELTVNLNEITNNLQKLTKGLGSLTIVEYTDSIVKSRFLFNSATRGCWATNAKEVVKQTGIDGSKLPCQGGLNEKPAR